MKKYILLIMMNLSAIVSVLASEDVPKFLDSNKVWEYGYEVSDMFTAFVNGYLYRYEIDGTEEYRGKKYQILWQTQEINWKRRNDPTGEVLYLGSVDTISTKRKMALLREEDNKVYMPYMNDGSVFYTTIIDRPIPNYEYLPAGGLWYVVPWLECCCAIYFKEYNENDEILLLDFNYYPEEHVTFWGFSDENLQGDRVDDESYMDLTIYGYTPCMFELEIINRKEETIKIGNKEIKTNTLTAAVNDGEIRSCHSFNSYVGPIGNNVFILGPVIRYMAVANGIMKDFWFNNLYDKEGNIIFEGENIQVPEYNAGVEAVKADARGDGRMYDVLGREVSDPQPGTIYIQNGRKYIAR